MEDADILRVQARIARVTLTAHGAELTLSTDLDDDVYILAQAAGRDCAVAIQLSPEPVA